jgi:hypothetical protein
MYTRSSDGGSLWSSPLEILAQAGTDYLYPAIAGISDGGLIVAAAGIRDFEPDSSSAWILECRRSGDAGLTWAPAGVLDTLTTISTAPAVAVRGSRVNILAMMGYRVWSYGSTDGGVTFTGKQIHAANSTTPTCTFLDTTIYAAWRHLNKDSLPYWNILYDRKPWRSGDHAVTTNDTSTYSYLPSLEADGDSLIHLLYQHLTTATPENSWSLLHRRLTGPNDPWGPPIEIAPGRTVWSPVIRGAPSGDLHAVWADLSATQWSIRSSISTDHGDSWEASIQRTSGGELALHPSLATQGDTVAVVWEEWQSGTPAICFTRFSVFETRGVPMEPAWNLFSLPVDPPDRSVEGLFHCSPFCTVSAFDSGGYHWVDTVFPGRAYWVRYPEAGAWRVRGRVVHGDTIAVQAGWNLVGCLSDTASEERIVSIPQGNLQWPAFMFTSQGYQPAHDLQPGRGYWIKAAGPGSMVIPAP